jgi:hypothetical protein
MNVSKYTQGPANISRLIPILNRTDYAYAVSTEKRQQSLESDQMHISGMSPFKMTKRDSEANFLQSKTHLTLQT